MRREVQEVRHLETARERDRDAKTQQAIDKAVERAVEDLKIRHEQDLAHETTRIDAQWQNKSRLQEERQEEEVSRLQRSLRDKDQQMSSMLDRLNALEDKAGALNAAEKAQFQLRADVERLTTHIEQLDGELRQRAAEQRSAQAAADDERREVLNLRSKLDYKESEIQKVTEQAKVQLEDAVQKNESLLEIVRRRDGELKDAFARTKDLEDERKEAKRRVADLEHRLQSFAAKNKELDEIINEKLVERAERYKNQIQGMLNRSEQSAVHTEQSISHAFGQDSQTHSQPQLLVRTEVSKQPKRSPASIKMGDFKVEKAARHAPKTQPAKSARSEEKLNDELTEYVVAKPARLESGRAHRNLDLGGATFQSQHYGQSDGGLAFHSHYGKRAGFERVDVKRGTSDAPRRETGSALLPGTVRHQRSKHDDPMIPKAAKSKSQPKSTARKNQPNFNAMAEEVRAPTCPNRSTSSVTRRDTHDNRDSVMHIQDD